MPEYLCVDGPLAGQQLAWWDPSELGGTLTIAMVDVGQPEVGPEDEPEADYLVERAAHDGMPGLLRFVAARGAWRPAREPLLPL